MVTLALEPGGVTTATVVVGQDSVVKELEVLDLGAWLDRLIRSAHRTDHTVRAVVVEPAGEQDLMTQVAVRTIRRVLDIYETVKAEWR